MVQALDRGALGVIKEMDTHAIREPLNKLVVTLMLTAFDERRPTLDQGVSEAAARLGVEEAAAETSFGNVLRALKKGTSAAGAERTLVGTLGALGAAASTDPSTDARLAHALLWVSAHSPFDPVLPLLALGGERANRFAEAFLDVARRYDDADVAVDRPTALVAALALGRGARAELLERARVTLRDPLLLTLLRSSEGGPAASGPAIGFEAERTSAPRHPLWTALLLMTFVLPLWALVSAFARVALRLKRPASISINKAGVTVKSRTELLGKTLREQETFLPAGGLQIAAREVRYPGLPTYVGIGSLLLGSFIGLRLVMDGARAGSPEFLSLGVAVLLVGLAIDYALTRLPARTPEHCRMLFVPKSGAVVAIAHAPRASADRALEQLKP